MKYLHNYKHPSREQLLEIFKLTPFQSNNARIRFIKSKIQHYEQETNRLLSLRIQTRADQAWLPDMFFQEASKKLQRYSRSYHFLQKRKKYLKEVARTDKQNKGDTAGTPRGQRQHLQMEPLDVEGAKEYPCAEILQAHGIKVSANGKFKLRDENTPSCSINPRNNYWKDFGSGEGGDSIALYQKLNNCTFVEAVRALT